MKVSSLYLIVAMSLVGASAFSQETRPLEETIPLKRGVAQSDHLRERPLLDALELGFCGLETHVWLVDGKLLVGAGPTVLKAEDTIERVYLDPLMKRVVSNGGRVFEEGPTFTIFINARSEAEPAYEALKNALSGYAPILTTFAVNKTSTNAVTVVLTGNRPRETMEKERERMVGYDAKISELNQKVSPDFMPVVSDDWNTWFRWRGEGAIGDEDKARLTQLVALVRHHKLGLRLHGAPDNEELWTLLYKEKVNLIDSKEYYALAKFLTSLEKFNRAMRRRQELSLPLAPPSPR